MDMPEATFCTKRFRLTLTGLVAFAGVFLFQALALANIPAGMPCSDCHTMHNSQNGAPVVSSVFGGVLDSADTDPRGGLLKKNCTACHMGLNTGANTTPYVFSIAPDIPTYGVTGTENTTNTSAGGSFYWVATDPATGHNVQDVAAQDPTLGIMAPGAPAGYNLTQLRCAGPNGCHGDRSTGGEIPAMYKTHHPIVTNANIDGTTPAKSFRFLNGVVGIEDSDWEYRPTADAHNQYKGEDRYNGTETTDSAGTISHFCAICHPKFHSGSGNISSTMKSPWLRHPTDIDIFSRLGGTEYVNYDGDAGVAGNQYDPAVPLASSTLTTVQSTVSANNSIITCVTCHRAHGSPYYKAMRWNYRDANLTVALKGCVRCHTTKN